MGTVPYIIGLITYLCGYRLAYVTRTGLLALLVAFENHAHDVLAATGALAELVKTHWAAAIAVQHDFSAM